MVQFRCQPQSKKFGTSAKESRHYEEVETGGGETRKRIVTAAAEEFREHGIVATGLAELMSGRRAHPWRLLQALRFQGRARHGSECRRSRDDARRLRCGGCRKTRTGRAEDSRSQLPFYRAPGPSARRLSPGRARKRISPSRCRNPRCRDRRFLEIGRYSRRAVRPDSPI